MSLIEQLTSYGLLQQYKLALSSKDWHYAILLEEEIFCRMGDEGGE